MRVSEVLRLVSGALQDLEEGAESRWKWEGGTDDAVGLVDYFNSAVLSIILQRPDATAVTKPVQLLPGMVQKIPRDALLMVELVRNLGEDGETPGPAIAPIAPDILLAWGFSGQTGKTVENFAYDRSTNPQIYYVYPCVPECPDVYVEMTYSAHARIVISPDECLPLTDNYAPAVFHHMLASILSGDSETSNFSKAQYHMKMYQQVLGIKSQVDAAWPKASISMGGNTK
ncbi:MAG: hypothetical protein LBR82_02060 [Desulfovibrio sp.]|jgi:hypothetical protein|nr:hypothetical protein [Desulfovibrio sp.]